MGWILLEKDPVSFTRRNWIRIKVFLFWVQIQNRIPLICNLIRSPKCNSILCSNERFYKKIIKYILQICVAIDTRYKWLLFNIQINKLFFFFLFLVKVMLFCSIHSLRQIFFTLKIYRIYPYICLPLLFLHYL